jgi:hypothetical protein
MRSGPAAGGFRSRRFHALPRGYQKLKQLKVSDAPSAFFSRRLAAATEFHLDISGLRGI